MKIALPVLLGLSLAAAPAAHADHTVPVYTGCTGFTWDPDPAVSADAITSVIVLTAEVQDVTQTCAFYSWDIFDGLVEPLGTISRTDAGPVGVLASPFGFRPPAGLELAVCSRATWHYLIPHVDGEADLGCSVFTTPF